MCGHERLACCVSHLSWCRLRLQPQLAATAPPIAASDAAAGDVRGTPARRSDAKATAAADSAVRRMKELQQLEQDLIRRLQDGEERLTHQRTALEVRERDVCQRDERCRRAGDEIEAQKKQLAAAQQVSALVAFDWSPVSGVTNGGQSVLHVQELEDKLTQKAQELQRTMDTVQRRDAASAALKAVRCSRSPLLFRHGCDFPHFHPFHDLAVTGDRQAPGYRRGEVANPQRRAGFARVCAAVARSRRGDGAAAAAMAACRAERQQSSRRRTAAGTP